MLHLQHELMLHSILPWLFQFYFIKINILLYLNITRANFYIQLASVRCLFIITEIY